MELVEFMEIIGPHLLNEPAGWDNAFSGSAGWDDCFGDSAG